MRIFACVPLYPPRSRVGAWLATHEFMRALAARGHDVTVMPWMQIKQEAQDVDGVRVVPRGASIVRLVEKADVVVSHMGDNGIAHKKAKAYGVPSVRMVHSPRDDARRLLAGAALVVANSKATLEATGWNRPALICPPPTWPDQHATASGDCVTLVNLSAAKGAELFWALAEQMPDVPFLGVRGGYGHQLIAELSNVTVLPTQDDMRAVWSRTRLLLMPSEREAWGMTGIEAMCSGIPVLAHPTPGLKESLSDAGTFIDRSNVGSWQRMVRKVIDRPSTWNVMSQLAKKRIAELDPQASVDRFCDAVETLG